SADEKKVLENRWRRVIGDDRIDFSVRAKALYRFTGGCIQCNKPSAGSYKDTRRDVGLAWPIRDTALGERATGTRRDVEFPNFFSGLRVQCENTTLRRQIHHAVCDDRRNLRQAAKTARACVAAIGSIWHPPRELKLADISRIDLFER